MPIVWPFSGSPAPKVLCCEVKGKREALYMRKELPVGRRSTVARDNYLFHRTRNQLITMHAACVKNPGLRNNDTYSYVSRPPFERYSHVFRLFHAPRPGIRWEKDGTSHEYHPSGIQTSNPKAYERRCRTLQLISDQRGTRSIRRSSNSS